MSLNDTLNAHADAFRQKTGVSSKLTIADMTRLLDDLSWNKTNLLKGTSDQYRALTNSDNDTWLRQSSASSSLTPVADYHDGNWFTYSATVTNTSTQPVQLELSICSEDKTRIKNTQSTYAAPAGAKDFQIAVSAPITAATHFVRTWLIFQGGKGTLGEKIQVKNERLYEGTEPGIWTPNPADQVGGNLPNLLPNAEAKYLPNNVKNDNFDCYVTYQDTSINMKQGGRYIVIAETNGTFSSQHEPAVESDKCILWLTNYNVTSINVTSTNIYTQLISDENTSQGTVFTWNGSTGTYCLRVNAYHKAADNTIYASNIRIYEL